MPQDAFHIRRLSAELAARLVGGKINRISQVSKDELTFIIYTKNGTVKLILSTNASNARVCLSQTEKEPLAAAPNFCMLLRKHLQNAEILSVSQCGFERIIQIDFLCTSDFSQSERTLYCELMGKYSNLILTEKGRILGALKSTSLTDDYHRILLPSAPYALPAPQDKISHLDGAGMRSALQSFASTHGEYVEAETLADFVFSTVAGVALSTAREIVARCKALNGGALDCLLDSAKVPLWSFITDFIENEPCVPCLLPSANGYADFFAFEVAGGERRSTLAEVEDIFYSFRENKKAFDEQKRRLEGAVKALKKKLTKRLQETLERLKDAENADDCRIKGELLTANLYAVERGAKQVTLVNWYSENGESLTIDLDSALSPSQNAQRYFKQYNKYKRAKEILLSRKQEEEAELSYIESILSSTSLAETEVDFKEIESELIECGLLPKPKAKIGGKKKEEAIPFREYNHGGVTVLVGRNNLQNDRLLRQADGEDIWLHAQKYHSSHVIIQARGKQVQDETLLFAAELCAYYSSGRDADKIPVDYCRRKFVKKPKGAKAGFVTYTNYKTLLVTPKKR